MDTQLSQDLLSGAKEIAEFTGLTRAQVYHLVEIDGLPIFRLGNRIYLRKSTLVNWISDQEKTALTQPNKAA